MSRTHNTKSGETSGRLLARPSLSVGKNASSNGLQSLRLGDSRETLLYVPPKYQPGKPLPLILLLHGAGGNARGGMTPFLPAADKAGLILLAPSSRGRTWDVIIHNYGEDVRSINRALSHVFNSYAIDASHLAIGGFSDGASYALSLGLTNGDLFTHIIAFSPGFMVTTFRQGKPHVFISHGTHDTVLPIDRCSRRVVRQLRQEHYDVRYHEFDGPHTIPVEIVREAWNWFSSSEE